MLAVSLGIKLGLEPESLARWLGLALGALTIAAAARFAGRNATPARSLWIAPALLAVHPAMSVWAAGGLETSLFACLVAWGVCLAAFGADDGSLRPRSAVLLAPASLTRPEGAAIAALVPVLALVPGPSAARRSSVIGWILRLLRACGSLAVSSRPRDATTGNAP